jgi:hypothetical protein
MKIKDGVIMAGLHPIMRKVLQEADAIWKRYGQELVVTSGLEGEHSAGSLHYYGRALDFRSRYFKDEDERREVCNALAHALFLDNNCYNVVYHDTHIHVEYDVPGC